MDEAEFDKFADEYRSLHAANISITGEGPEFFAEYKMRDLATEYAARRAKSDDAPAILDFGSGVGTSVPFIRKYLPRARLTCVDISAKSLAIGEARFADQARFLRFDGEKIPLPDASADVAFAACVFHHIADEKHLGLLREFRRVLASTGLAFVFEHNPYNPLTLHAVNTCPFDENAKLISARAMRQKLLAAGFVEARIRYRIFFPRALSALRPLEKWLAWVPLGAQYYVLAMK
jgi:ubiquinone/menaquinone biosynthesis C-methylase UbiE